MRAHIGLSDPVAWYGVDAGAGHFGLPTWRAGFTRGTPTELIAAVADVAGEERVHPRNGPAALDVDAVAEAFLAGGWCEPPGRSERARYLLSPDGMAVATLRRDARTLITAMPATVPASAPRR